MVFFFLENLHDKKRQSVFREHDHTVTDRGKYTQTGNTKVADSNFWEIKLELVNCQFVCLSICHINLSISIYNLFIYVVIAVGFYHLQYMSKLQHIFAEALNWKQPLKYPKLRPIINAIAAQTFLMQMHFVWTTRGAMGETKTQSIMHQAHWYFCTYIC